VLPAVPFDVTSPSTAASPLLSLRERRLALAGIVGVGGFGTAWAVLGATRTGYSPVEDAISRLAEDGAATQSWMMLGFVTFGIGVPLYALALRRALAGPAWLTAFATGLATLAVAGLPLGVADDAHRVAAGIGYATLAATPLLAARTFHSAGQRRWAAWSVACGVTSALLLAASVGGPVHGLTQRAGLAATDAWIVVTAWTMWRTGRLPG